MLGSGAGAPEVQGSPTMVSGIGLGHRCKRCKAPPQMPQVLQQQLGLDWPLLLLLLLLLLLWLLWLLWLLLLLLLLLLMMMMMMMMMMTVMMHVHEKGQLWVSRAWMATPHLTCGIWPG